MTAAPSATRMTANSIARDRERLTREAKTIAEDAARIAEDIERGIAIGAHTRLAQDVQQFLIRAIRYDATRDTAELFTSELAATQETP
ncbi:hypothetical protein [Streptomyces sp. NPDC020983]|uniref:hypothetical protein n=1 Tax=Streptomyces sp. NPDC020983 TaxID=3365106 RepID=UPI0037B2B557